MVKAFLAFVGCCLISSEIWASPTPQHFQMGGMNPMDMFMANHGKRSVEMVEDRRESNDEGLESEVEDELLLPYFSAPTGFFFLPKLGKRGFSFADLKRGPSPILTRPNGFLFPTNMKRSDGIYLRPNSFLFPSKGKRRNPNGFNFPVLKSGKRSELAAEIDSLEDTEDMEAVKRGAPIDMASLEEFMGQRGKKVMPIFTATRGKRGSRVKSRADSLEDVMMKLSKANFSAARGR